MASNNVKIKNATPLEYDNIQFKSKLEVAIYKALKEEGYNPQYEKVTYKLQDSKLYPTLHYAPFKDRKKHVNTWGLNTYKIIGMKYTPDFTFNLDDRLVVVEAKGYQNDRYAYQKKLFFKWLEDNTPNSAFFEIHNMKQLKQALEILRGWRENL